jgi:mono/diheme cytochrome c family protein
MIKSHWFFLLALLLALPVVAADAAKPSVHAWNDDRVKATGAWYPVANGNETGPYMLRSDKAGDTIELDFCGTEVGLLHQAGGLGWEWGIILPDTGHALGTAEVRVDGAAPFVIDTSKNGRTLLANGLAPGRHRVTVRNLGRPSVPGGSGAIAVKGFWVDASGSEAARSAWLAADSVHGSETWRARAAELAAAAVSNADFSDIGPFVAAARKMEEATAPLRVCTVLPDLPMIRNEASYWTPDTESEAYFARLRDAGKRLGTILSAIDNFRWDAKEPAKFDALSERVRLGEKALADFRAGELKRLPPLLFYTGTPLQSSAAPNHIWSSNPLNGKWGCSIRSFDPAHPETPAKILFEDPNAIIFDLTVAPDAKTAFFSMRRGQEQCWHIYSIGTDGTGLKRITSGPWYDVSPAPLPDGRIAFISSRTPGTHTVCQSGPSTHVYVMDGDGSNARDLSANTLSDFGLSAMADGRLLFTRWEYVDVNLTYRQSLWTQRPDGSQFSLWFGNLAIDPATIWQAAEIPSRYAVVCTFAPHHNTPRGAIGLVTNRSGVDSPRGTGFRWLTKRFPAILDQENFWGYCDPFPVFENRYLVSYGGLQRFVILLLDDFGNEITVYGDPATSCFGAHPIVARPAPARLVNSLPAKAPAIAVPAAPPGQPAATNVPLARLMLTDVYRGLPSSIKRGDVASIRIMEQLPKTVNRTWYKVMDQGPLMSASTYYAKRVWGYAPVESDGSAFFEAPALKEIYLQACDAQGRELQRMTSVLTLMPGETQSCAGCHESRLSAPLSGAAPSGMASASSRAPTPLTFPKWGNAGILDYNKIVQPVFDRNCVRCHSGANPPAGVLLTGHYTRFFNMSYNTLVIRSQAEQKSRDYYTSKSRERPMVQSLHLLYGTMLPFSACVTNGSAQDQSGSFVSRLPDFFRAGHCKHDVPADDMRVIYEWIDAMIPYYSTTDFAHREALSNRDKWADKDSRALLPWFNRFAAVFNSRCASCHGKAEDTGSENPRPLWAWLDLTVPADSPALTAHLAKAAGGRGLPAKGEFAFKDKNDPDYIALLAAITEAGKAAYETPEADMPGFVPRCADKAFQYNYIRHVGPETLASRSCKTVSHCCASDSPDAMTDGVVPAVSCDTGRRFSWYDRKGSTEWAAMEFPEPAKVSRVRVFWFSDRARGGGCDFPVTWRLLCRDGKGWKPVEGASAYGVLPDRFNDVSFTPVTTSALRIEARLQPGWSGGICEWIVE